ncbi:MAG: hypothetical protein V3S40_05225 [Kiloniellales bacterium]|jgi:hypothetical protein
MARVVLPTPVGGTEVYQTGAPRTFEGARSAQHLAELFRLADRAGIWRPRNRLL